ncbi:acetyl-CoA C-acetyltransferase [Kribbella sp. NPDC049227]|uniref:acetyl-CoA C-acetyltransferase n=1 Tax=Kribbella sp. NPDC049227 TaxID=3364113 RepID=UPI00371270C6
MPEAVIVATARSPIGRARKGSLRDLRPDDLAAVMVRAALDQVPALDPVEIDDLYVGSWEHGGEQGENLARRVAVQLGLDPVPGSSVNRACASSVQTTRMACNAIRAGDGSVFVSAGVECVSHYPDDPADHTNPMFAEALRRTKIRARGHRTGWVDPRLAGALPDVYIGMGQTAENVAALCGISRQEQDEFALRSQTLTAAALEAGFYKREIVPVVRPDGTVVDGDDGPRPATTQDDLAGLQPVFRPDGSVTPGNCCPLNDGAAAVVVMSDVRALELGITPLARVVGFGVSGLSPEIMGLGPVEASRRALAKASMTIADVDLVEINEAFAAQVIPSYRQLGIDIDRLNVHGGGIALGHPFGATGARITTTLINGLQARDREIGLETMCVGGGMGMAMILQRLS